MLSDALKVIGCQFATLLEEQDFLDTPSRWNKLLAILPPKLSKVRAELHEEWQEHPQWSSLDKWSRLCQELKVQQAWLQPKVAEVFSILLS